MDKITVFGASGFIGSNFCEMYPKEIIKATGYIPRSNTVLYLISTTDNYNVLSDPHIDINTNLNYLMDVLWAHKFESDLVFNFTSSWFTYGEVELPAKEDACCNPRGFYSITKKCAEDLIISFCKTYNLRYRIFRLANVYGVGDKFSERRNGLQFLIDKMSDHEPIGLYYNGDFLRDYIYVTDVCRAMKLCMEKAPVNQIINIGSEGSYIFGRLIRYAHEKLESKSYIEAIPPSEFHKVVQVRDMELDITKLKRLGFEPEVDIWKGLDKVIEDVKRRRM